MFDHRTSAVTKPERPLFLRECGVQEKGVLRQSKHNSDARREAWGALRVRDVSERIRPAVNMVFREALSEYIEEGLSRELTSKVLAHGGKF